MEFIAFQVRDFICDVSMSYLLCIILCIKVSRDTYNNRCISNMQLNDGPHGAWVGACRTSSASAFA